MASSSSQKPSTVDSSAANGVRSFGSPALPISGHVRSYRQRARANVALKRACKAAQSGAPTANNFFVVAIWTCAAARAALIDEFGTFMAIVLFAAKLAHMFLVELLVSVKAVRTIVWLPQSGD